MFRVIISWAVLYALGITPSVTASRVCNIGNTGLKGTVPEIERPSLLSYTFTIKPVNGAMTTVTWQLEDAHGSTILTLRHAGIDKAAGAAALGLLMALDAGWDKHLACLQQDGIHNIDRHPSVVGC